MRGSSPRMTNSKPHIIKLVFICIVLVDSQFLHLTHFELDPRRPAEDGNCDLEPRATLVDFLHHAVEGRKRSLRYPYLLAHFEGHRRLGPLDAFLHLVHDARGLGVRNRLGLVVGAEKSRDLRRVLDEVIGLIREIHLHQHVAGEELALGVDLLPAAHFHDLFGRHHYLVEQMLEVALFGLLTDRIGDLALEIRIRLDDVPMLVGHSARLLHPPMPRMKVTAIRTKKSATMKNAAATNTITNTMSVVMKVSRLLGQVTFCASTRTSCKNLNGLSFAIRPTCRRLGRAAVTHCAF